MQNKNLPSQLGFTLVELSIVLVVVGLLISGILVGQSLVEASKVSKIVRDVAQIQAALQTFKSKYKFYPGDYPNGFQFGCPAGANWQCTGSGDGLLQGSEALNTWYQLTKSGTLAGNYSGRSYTVNPFIAGGDIPAVKEVGDNTGYMLGYWNSGDPTLTLNKNYIIIARNTVNGAALSVERTIAIDSKVDDGRYSGKSSGIGTAYVCQASGSYYKGGNITAPNACVLWI